MRRKWAFASAVITPLFLAAAQAPGPGRDQPSFRTETHLVLLQAVVRDQTGKPVTNLIAEDFSLIDEGVLQKIAVLERPGEAHARAPLPPRVFSNQAAGGSSLAIILIDALNTRAADQLAARDRLVRLFSSEPPPVRTAVFSLGPSLELIHGPSDDADSLVAALRGYEGRAEFPGIVGVIRLPEKPPKRDPVPTRRIFRDAEIRQYETEAANRAADTIRALHQLAARFAGVPARKHLIWLSGGFSLIYGPAAPNALTSRPTHTFTEPVDQLVRSLASANFTVHSIDIRPFFTLEAPGQAVMRAIAAGTGGQAVMNPSDLGASIASLYDEAVAAYTLGFYPAHNRWDGGFRRVSVAVRRSGLSISAQSGYFATASQTPAEGKPRTREADDRALQQAILSPVDSKAIPVVAQVEPVPGEPTVLRLSLSITPNNLRFIRESGRWKTSFYLVTYHVGSTRSQAPRETLTLSLTDDQFSELLKSSITLDREIPLETGTEALRLVIFDPATSLVGSVTMSVNSLQQ